MGGAQGGLARQGPRPTSTTTTLQLRLKIAIVFDAVFLRFWVHLGGQKGVQKGTQSRISKARTEAKTKQKVIVFFALQTRLRLRIRLEIRPFFGFAPENKAKSKTNFKSEQKGSSRPSGAVLG